MAKKTYFLIIDTETTVESHVADFGAVICDKKGNIENSCGVLVNNFFGKEELFYDKNTDPNCIWSKKGLEQRKENYTNMLNAGIRMLASVAAINNWLLKAKDKYNPVMTAYNLPFDLDKCAKSAIDLTVFTEKFCLWSSAASIWGKSKKYKNFVLDCHGFNSPTKLGNMSYKTNAEIMARYALNNPNLPDEPHTALEDIVYYEMPILVKLCKRNSIKTVIDSQDGYNWRDYQVKEHYTAK